MSLIFAAVVPALLPPKDSLHSLDFSHTANASFMDAYRVMEGELYCMRPDVIMIISEDGDHLSSCITLNIAPNLHTRHSSTTHRGNITLATHMQHAANNYPEFLPLTIISDDTLPASTDQALTLLATHLPFCNILPVSTNQTKLSELYHVGIFFRGGLLQTNERIAVIAVGTLGNEKNNQYHTQTIQHLVQTSIHTNSLHELAKIEPSFIQKSHATLIRPLVLLSGILHGANVKPEQHGEGIYHGEHYLFVNFAFS